MTAVLKVFTLGGLKLRLDQQPAPDLANSKAAALLVYLACTRRVYSREVLAELLWDERAQSQALGNLRVVLTALRKQFSAYLEITRSSVGLQPDAPVWTDAGEFEAHLQAARQARPFADPRSLQEAVDLYCGDFLEGFYLREAAGFEAWLVRERERLHQLAASALQELVTQHLQAADYPAGLAAANRLLELDSLNEAAHRQAMLLLVGRGRRGEAEGERLWRNTSGCRICYGMNWA
jgi:DNA-binding SARP family transcriptional activator